MTPKAKNELREIIRRDYGSSITDEQADELGFSLLRLTRIALAALARASDQESLVQARDSNTLGAKTST